jgi:Icc protein
MAYVAEGNVDLTLYGHIHTFIPFRQRRDPAYSSGGGAAAPMRLDGIDRHFLVIELAPADGLIAPLGGRMRDT